jgi:hypothetical protein
MDHQHALQLLFDIAMNFASSWQEVCRRRLSVSSKYTFSENGSLQTGEFYFLFDDVTLTFDVLSIGLLKTVTHEWIDGLREIVAQATETRTWDDGTFHFQLSVSASRKEVLILRKQQ